MSISALDFAKAKAFTMWVKNIIGSEPAIINVNDQFLEIDFTEAEITAMKKWLDNQVGGLLKPRPVNVAPPTVQIKLGKIIVPWSVQYLFPIIAGVFGIGYLTGNFLTRRK